MRIHFIVMPHFIALVCRWRNINGSRSISMRMWISSLRGVMYPFGNRSLEEAKKGERVIK